MVDKKEKIWTKLGKGAELPNGQPILSDYFQKQGKIMKSKRCFQILGNCIYYFGDNLQQPKGMTVLNFELKFEVIREKVDKKDSKQEKVKLGKAKGLKLDKGGCVCEIYNSDEQIVLKWRDYLRNILNQRGFHELFRAHKKIGKGNFASVYLAERIEDEKFFAVKAFSKEAAYTQEKGKEALINEIELMRQLNHPNIIRLHEVFETENSLYMILDLLEGGQLYDKIKIKYRFTLEESKQIIQGIVSGLAHMHSQGIMHRDLKPENIIFKKPNSMEVSIVDFGLATRIDEKEYLFVRCGTPGFVAPEVVNIKDLNVHYDAVCDVFSAGLIFHILLQGKSPFNGKTYNEILQQNRACNIKLDGHEYLRLPLAAYDLLKRMLEKDPLKRIRSTDAQIHKFFSQQAQEKTINQNTITNEQKTEPPNDFDEEDIVDEGNDGAKLAMSKLTEEYQTKFDMSKMNNHQQSPNLGVQGMQSPVLPMRQLKRINFEADSCVSFKMSHSPVLTGRVDSIMHESNGFESPGAFLVADRDRKINQMAMQGIKQMETPKQSDVLAKRNLMMQTVVQEVEEKKESSPKSQNQPQQLFNQQQQIKPKKNQASAINNVLKENIQIIYMFKLFL